MDTKQPRRGQVLDEVKKTICVDRNNQHGEPENTFPMIAAAWTRYLQDFGLLQPGKELKPSDVAKMMEEFKECRYRANPNNPDNLHDKIGYTALAIELREIEQTNEPKRETYFVQWCRPRNC